MGKKDIYKITINNWEKYNGHLKKSHKSIMISTGFLTDAKVRNLTPSGKLLYLSCLLLAGESTRSQFNVSHESLVFQSGVKSGSLQSQLDLLQSLQLVTVEKNEPFINRIERNRKERKGINGGPEIEKPERPKTRQEPPPPLDQIWNSVVKKLPKVQTCGKSRIVKMKSRWKENPDPEFWRNIILKLDESNFCTGNNDRNWVASFDFLLAPETATKVLEGKYDNRETKRESMHDQIKRELGIS